MSTLIGGSDVELDLDVELPIIGSRGHLGKLPPETAVQMVATAAVILIRSMGSMDSIDTYPIPGFREPVSCFSHLVAAPVFAILGYYLVRRGHGNRVRTASLAVMVFSTVFLLSMSAVYHLLSPGSGRSVMRHLDIAGVFVLIAGSMTPVHAILFRGFSRWAPLLLVWSAAATGITLRTIFAESLPRGVGSAIFLLLGWGGLISCILLWRRYGFRFVRPLLWGGLAYTLGVFILGLKWPTLIPGVIGAHELWHLAVLVGLGLHWEFVFQFAGGRPVTESSRAQALNPT